MTLSKKFNPKYLLKKIYGKYTCTNQIKEIFKRLNFDDKYIQSFFEILSVVLLLSVAGKNGLKLVNEHLKISVWDFFEILEDYDDAFYNLQDLKLKKSENDDTMCVFAQDLYNCLLLKLIMDVNNNFKQMFRYFLFYHSS